MSTCETPSPPPERLLGIDALRGFDMFWIMGADSVLQAAAKWMPPRTAEVVRTQLDHADWEGFRFYDLIFPLFLFLVGTVLPFSLGKILERGGPSRAVYTRILRRTALLIFLGLVCNGILKFQFGELRYVGVLQRIGICYGCAALIYLHTSRVQRVAALAAILLGYWALLATVPAPGGKAGDFSKEGNLAGYVDRHALPGKIMKQWYGYGDNEGLLSTLPAIGTALLGVLAGEWLRSVGCWKRRVAGLAVAGLACLVAGFAWSSSFPIIKNLWTSSFVLVAGGFSLLLLALFHLVVDVLGWRGWAFPLIVIGSNAIAIFVVPRFIDFKFMTQFFLAGVLPLSGEYQPLVLLTGMLVFKWLFLLFLYRHRIFLRV